MNVPVILRRRRSSVSPLAIYAVLGIRPELVLDFDDEKYFANSASTTFSNAITHSATTNATMVDSDGLLKWRPHNLALNSASPATQSITVVSGADYTVECTGVSIALSGAGTGTVTEGNPVTITASTTTLTLTVTGSTGTMWAYRSDLGGMVNNPDRGDSYVPTTSSAVYLPRRGHHVYNGSAWVNEGLLHESEQRVNLVTYSRPNNTNWATGGVVITENVSGQTAPDGTDTFTFFREDASNAVHFSSTPSINFTVGEPYTFSGFVKKATSDDLIQITFPSAAFGASQYANFNTATGAFATTSGVSTHLEDFGGGVYRIGITATATATASGSPGFVLTNNNDSLGRTPIYVGDGTNGFYVWGAQLEAGSTPSSYIPTSGSTVTREAETLTVPSAQLPWPTPNVIGPELVTNGTFDTDTSGWSSRTGGVFSWDNGKASITSAGPFAGIEVPAPYLTGLTIGKVYRISADFELGTSTEVGVAIRTTDDATGLGASYLTSDGTATFVFTASTTSVRLLAINRNNSGSFKVDNISVREIDPLAVSIQMQGRMTYADTGATEVTFSRWYKDGDNFITSELSAASGRTGKPVFIQEALAIQDAVLASSDYAPGINVPFNIASRHGSTFINGSVDGTALTANTTPTALPDLSATDLSLGFNMMGTIKMLRIWADDLGDNGLEVAST